MTAKSPAQNGVGPDDRIGRFDDVADPDIRNDHVGGQSAVIDRPFEIQFPA